MRNIVLAAAVAAMLTSTASAGVVLDNFVTPGFQNIITDNSVSQVVKDTSSPGFISVGDIIQGIIRLDQQTQPGPGYTASASDQLVIVFAAKVAAPTGTFILGNANKFDLVPVTTADGAFTLKDMLPTQLAGYTSASLSNAIFAVLDGSTATNPTGQALATALTGIDSATYTLDLIGGLLAGDFFKSTLVTTNIALIGSVTPGTLLGDEIGGLSIIDNLTTYTFDPTTAVTGYDLVNSNHQFTFNGQLRAPTATQKTNGYQVADKTDVSFTLAGTGVPEPGSMLVWASLGCLAAFRGMRRKTTTVA